MTGYFNSGHGQARLPALQVFDLGGGTLDVAVLYVPAESPVRGTILIRDCFGRVVQEAALSAARRCYEVLLQATMQLL